MSDWLFLGPVHMGRSLSRLPRKHFNKFTSWEVNNGKKRTKIFGIKKILQASLDFGILLSNFLGFWDLGLKNLGICWEYLGLFGIFWDFYRFLRIFFFLRFVRICMGFGILRSGRRFFELFTPRYERDLTLLWNNMKSCIALMWDEKFSWPR